MMIEQEKDPSYQYAIHQKEFALPEHFRGDFLGAYDKFAECDPHDLPAVEKALNENKEQLASWVAMAMWHIERLSSSHFSPEEIQKREDIIQRVWKEKGWKADEIIDIATKRMPEVLPRWAGLLLLASYPLEKETIPEDKKRELTAFVFESMNSLSETGKIGAELAAPIKIKAADIYFQLPTDKQRKLSREELERQQQSQAFPGGLLRQFTDQRAKTEYAVAGKEFTFDTINLWRLLSRRGLTRWREFLGPKDQQRTQEEIGESLRRMATNKLTQKGAEIREASGVWSPSGGFLKDTQTMLQQVFGTGEFKLQEDVTVTPEQKVINGRFQPRFGEVVGDIQKIKAGNSLLQFGEHDMPDKDLRLSFELPEKLSVEEQVGEILDKPIKAITEAFMDGVPISCKITQSDFGEGTSKRFMVYADYYTARDLLSRLKALGYETKGQPVISKRGNYEYSFPFGDPRVHVRGTGEAEFSEPIVHHQLELLKSVK